MKYRKYASRVLSLSLVGVMAAGLCGCRASDEIQKIVYTADASEVDETEVVMNPDIDGEIDEASTEKKTDNEAKDSKQTKAPAQGEDANSDGTAEVADPNQKGDNDDPDSQNESNGINQNDNSSNGVNDGEQDGNTSGDGNQQGNQGGEDDTYDPDGNKQEVPEVDGYIAAPGEAGLIVQMLGGEDVLCASSESFISNHLVQQVFADEGIDEVQALWSDDGSEPMSPENFETLLAMEPEAVVTISGQQNFSDSQLQQLESAGVKKITIDLTRANNITGAVEAVGQLLGDHEVGNTTSVELAAEYVGYADDLLQDVASKRGYFYYKTAASDSFYKSHKCISNGCYTLVLWDWDDEFSFKYYGPDGNAYVNQSGGAVTRTGWTDNPSADYMSAAGVMNTTMRVWGADGSSSSEATEFIYCPFHSIVGIIPDSNTKGYDNLGISGLLGRYESVSEAKIVSSGSYIANCYLAEFGHGTYEIQNGKYSVTDSSAMIEVGYTTLTNKGNPVAGDVAWIGSERFKYIIAADQEIKENIESSKNNSTGLYAIRPYGIDLGVPGPYTTGSDFLNQFKNYYSTTFQEYEIKVNPYGCGSWLDGSVESVLESVWISDLYYDTYDVNKKIEDFYKTFYRHSLSSSQLSDILDGE